MPLKNIYRQNNTKQPNKSPWLWYTLQIRFTGHEPLSSLFPIKHNLAHFPSAGTLNTANNRSISLIQSYAKNKYKEIYSANITRSGAPTHRAHRRNSKQNLETP
jgi:hypothetical protein